MKSIFVKPSFIEKKNGEILIHIVDEKDIEFIDSQIAGGTAGFQISTLEQMNNRNTFSLPREQLQTYYNEYLITEQEKQADMVKLREIIKRMEHPKVSTFNNFCCDLFNIPVISHLCEYCGISKYPTIKSLSAHQRKCKIINKKPVNVISPVVSEPDPTTIETVAPVAIEPIVVEVPPPSVVAQTEKPVVVSAKQKLLKKAL